MKLLDMPLSKLVATAHNPRYDCVSVIVSQKRIVITGKPVPCETQRKVA